MKYLNADDVVWCLYIGCPRDKQVPVRIPQITLRLSYFFISTSQIVYMTHLRSAKWATWVSTDGR